MTTKPCPDCSVTTGTAHVLECDVARCLVTGYQRLSCEDEHDCGSDVWSGVWPDYITDPHPFDRAVQGPSPEIGDVVTTGQRYFRTVIEIEIITVNEPISENDEIRQLIIDQGGHITRWQASQIEYDLASALLRQQSLSDEDVHGLIGPPT